MKATLCYNFSNDSLLWGAIIPWAGLEQAILLANKEGHYENIILKFYVVSICFILSGDFLCSLRLLLRYVPY